MRDTRGVGSEIRRTVAKCRGGDGANADGISPSIVSFRYSDVSVNNTFWYWGGMMVGMVDVVVVAVGSSTA